MLQKYFQRSLRLDLPERQLRFTSIADFEFALASRTEVPAGKVSELIRLGSDGLRDEAGRIRVIERHLVDVLSQSMEEPGTIGGLLRELDIKLFSHDHEWRAIIEGLLRCGARFDEYKRLALVKYVQYLAARQDVLRTLYLGRREREKGVAPAEEHESAEAGSAMRDTVIFDVSQPPGESGGGRLQRLPVGEPVMLKLPASGEVDVVLSRHPFKIVAGGRHYLVDEAGHDYPLAPGRNVVGRQPGSDVLVDPAYRDISRKHLVIEVGEAGVLLLTDLSSHGTFIRAGSVTRA